MARDKEKQKAAQARYHAEHHEEEKIKNAKYRAEHKEESRERHARYYITHGEERKAYLAKYYAVNKEKKKIYQARYYREHRAENKAYNDQYRAGFREKVLSHYGGKCACPNCPETNPKFLTVDHINGGGTKHRKEMAHSKFYKWLVDNNFPDGFQLLCYNCNCARAKHNGVCPHMESH